MQKENQTTVFPVLLHRAATDKGRREKEAKTSSRTNKSLLASLPLPKLPYTRALMVSLSFSQVSQMPEAHSEDSHDG